MRDDTSLRRLAEIGIDVYRPRAAPLRRPDGSSADATRSAGAATPPAAPATLAGPNAPHTVLLLAAAVSLPEHALLADIARALSGSRWRCAPAAAPSAKALQGAHALVVFGEAQARAAGALLPAQRQAELGWVAAAELAVLAGDAAAKRALWSELKRLLRSR
jgi:DNA polymerase III psi subunit